MLFVEAKESEEGKKAERFVSRSFKHSEAGQEIKDTGPQGC